MEQRSHLRRDVFWTFDIETTTLVTGLDKEGRPERNAIIWSGQFYNGEEYIQERSLADVIRRLELIAYENQDNPYKILIVVHNLSYEFQFIKDFFKFEKILATTNRKIISAETDQLVFRCSYMLSNMGLEKFLENENVPEEFRKTNMDYLKERFPWTPLTEEEYIYCKNDVVGLHMAIQNRINHEHNKDVNNLPLTSTGYVRKDCRKAVNSNKKNRYRFFREKLDADTFDMCRKAFRGGNTHANRLYTNKVLSNVGSDDIRSSYPTELYRKYPGQFFDMRPFKRKEFNFYLHNWHDWGMLIEVTWKNLRLRNPDATPVPYLSISKCDPIKFHQTHGDSEKNKKQKARQMDNGRILRCEYCQTTITEVDYLIIMNQYEWDEEHITRVKVSKKHYLSEELLNQVKRYYYNKTTLKQKDDAPNFDPDKAYLYARSKELLNGIYGMHVTSPCKFDYEFDEDKHEVYEVREHEDHTPITEQELLDRYYSSFSNFLSYQVGVWVTAYARYHLQMAIDILGNKHNGGKTSDLVYCDTDSVKFLNPDDHIQDIEKLNQEYIKMAEERGAFVDYNGKRFHLGIFEYEGTAKKFKTFGAKKYLYSTPDGFKITISGVPKKAGKKCIIQAIKKGKMSSPFDLKKGFVFRGVKTTSSYMDHDCLHEWDVDGKKVYYASNIAMFPNSYTLGLTADYEILLHKYAEEMEEL